MKKQMMRVVNATSYSKFFKATALVLMLSGAASVQAQVTQVSSKIENRGTLSAEVNHLGTAGGMLLFQVKVNNNSGEKFKVIVKDIDGNILFQDYYNDKNFSKKYMIPKPDSDKLIFLVKSSAGNASQTFEINSNTRIVEEVVVTRI